MDAAQANNPGPAELVRLHVDGDVNAVAFNRDGSELAALSNFGASIQIFDTKTWKLKSAISRYGGAYAFNSLSFLPDNSLLTTFPIDNTPNVCPTSKSIIQKALPPNSYSLIQWDTNQATPIRCIPAETAATRLPLSINSTNTFTVSQDGSTIAAVTAYSVVMIDGKTGAILTRLSIPPLSRRIADGAQSVAFSPDGRELAVGTLGGQLYFFDCNNWFIDRHFSLYAEDQYSAEALAFSPSGHAIAVGRHKNFDHALMNGNMVTRTPSREEVTIVDPRDGRVIVRLPGPSIDIGVGLDTYTVRSLSWNRIGDVLAIGDDGGLRSWRVDGGNAHLVFVRPIRQGSYSVAFSADNVLASGAGDAVIVYGHREG